MPARLNLDNPGTIPEKERGSMEVLEHIANCQADACPLIGGTGPAVFRNVLADL